MLKRYLKQAPTALVIGVTGFAAWPALFPEGAASTTKEASKPPAKANASPSLTEASDRDPFQIARPKQVTAARSSSPASKASSGPSVEKLAALAELSAQEDTILGAMRLGGTVVGLREQIAIIDDRIYARGDALRKADGSPLPYLVLEVRKDSALIRRGRRNFVLRFSNAPRVAATKADGALAKAATPGKAAATPGQALAVKGEPIPSKKGRSGSQGPGAADGADPASMLTKLLSGIGGSLGSGGSSGAGSTGGGAASNPLSAALTGGASGANLGASGLSINPITIQSGLDALMGKYDNIGRESTPSGSTSTGGGTP